MIEQRILDAFQTMWGPFPEPVLLIQKDRTILAVNDLARAIGTPEGAKCYSLNPEVTKDESHCKRCRASEALRTGKPVWSNEQYGEKTVIGYWIPLKEKPGVYIHFGVGTAEMMAQAATSKAEQKELVQLS